VKAPDWGWTSDRVLTAWSVAAVFMAGCAIRSTQHHAPVLEPAILRIRTFSTATAAFAVFSTGFYALLLGNILFLTEVWHFSVLQAGLGVTPAALMAASAAAAGGRLVERFGSRQVAVPALVLFCCACLTYHAAGPQPNYVGHWLPAQLLSGTAIGLTFAALTSASVIGLPPAWLATGSAMSSCSRQIGAVVGIAGLVAVLGTPGPHALLSAFERAWMLMACTALGAALLASALPARRRDDRPEISKRRRPTRWADVPGVATNEMLVNGHRLVYRVAGTGPALLLVHGLLEDSLTWRKVIPRLARTHTVIAPDLFGHGESDAPPDVDYSPGAQAGTLRDLLDVLGHDRVTIVGHSLGGGVAMWFAYHYPARVHRMALISSGGFGREVHPAMRALSLPGAGPAVGLLTMRPTLVALAVSARLASAAGARRLARKARELQLTLTRVRDPQRRVAVLRTIRSVIGHRGQAVSALDRLYLMVRIPTLVLWGTRDRILPVHHASAVRGENPDTQIVLLDGIGHLPHLTCAEFVADRLSSFIHDAPASPPILTDNRVFEPSSARGIAAQPASVQASI
jgi:pimeloyl-ACP methyl ester carboxylesterase